MAMVNMFPVHNIWKKKQTATYVNIEKKICPKEEIAEILKDYQVKSK